MIKLTLVDENKEFLIGVNYYNQTISLNTENFAKRKSDVSTHE